MTTRLPPDHPAWPTEFPESLAQLRVAVLMRDADLLPRVQQTAELLLASYPDNIAALTARWIGAGERYGRVG